MTSQGIQSYNELEQDLPFRPSRSQNQSEFIIPNSNIDFEDIIISQAKPDNPNNGNESPAINRFTLKELENLLSSNLEGS